jgi:hypothetical protein
MYWKQRLAEVIRDGGFRRVEHGETFGHDKNGRIRFEVYATVPVPKAEEDPELDFSPFICMDCLGNTHHMNEYYMVHDVLWLQAVGSKAGMLCIGCLEARLKRRLTASDFTDALINSMPTQSERLSQRLQSKQGSAPSL